jgi:hypothetical protein
MQVSVALPGNGRKTIRVQGLAVSALYSLSVSGCPARPRDRDAPPLQVRTDAQGTLTFEADDISRGGIPCVFGMVLSPGQ